MTKIGRERGWPPMQRQDFDAGRTLRGALFVGSPAEVTEKILFQHEIFGHDRFLLQLSVGTMPHRDLLRAIELFGTEVAPAVRAALAPSRQPWPRALCSFSHASTAPAISCQPLSIVSEWPRSGNSFRSVTAEDLR